MKGSRAIILNYETQRTADISLKIRNEIYISCDYVSAYLELLCNIGIFTNNFRPIVFLASIPYLSVS